MPTQQLRPGYLDWIARLAILACFAVCGHPSRGSELRETAIVRAVKATRESVVNIHGHKTVDGPDESGDYEGPRRVNGMGTGVIIDERGYILTNHHVIEGVSRIRVTLADRRTYTANLVARDAQTDLAIIHISTSRPLPLIKVGTSADLMQGEPVVAMGNAYGYHHTVTRGIISALERTVEVTDSQKYFDLIQTDASINPGNSGGPLLNADGEMIGINVAVRVGAQGIGFAIPVDKAMEVAARLMRAEQTSGIWHGLAGTSSEKDGRRVFRVDTVAAGSPAEQAGIRVGDMVLQVGSTVVERALDVERALLGLTPGAQVAVSLARDAEKADVQLPLAAAPPRRQADEHRVAGDAWRMLGIRVRPIGSAELNQIDPRYNGGLELVAVQPDGLAAQNKMRPGDILVGIHVWETISLDNLDYVLNRAELEDPARVKFYVVRGTETRWAELPLERR